MDSSLENLRGEMYRRIVESIPEGVWVIDPQGQTLFTNPRMAEMLGVQSESMASLSCFACIFPEDRVEVLCQLARSLDRDRPPFDLRLRRPDGSPLWVSISSIPMRDEAGALTGMIAVFSDISERKRADDALRQSETRLRTLVDDAPVMTWMSGLDKKTTFYNVRALAFTGVPPEELVRDGAVQLIHPDDRERYLEIATAAADTHAPFSAEVRVRRADGEYRWVLISGVPRIVNGVFRGHIGTGVDVTDLRRSYEQNLAGQKLESLGVLAAGVAHDFNNWLGAIVARAESAQAELEGGSRAAEDVNHIRLTALRAAEIVSQLMTFAGHESAPATMLDLSGLVTEMLDLLKISISKLAVLRTELAADLPLVRANPGEIRQVIMNLILNASEALEGRAGSITITTARGSLGAASTPAVQLEVRDTGCGIPADLKGKIFDPFFTTRSNGRGLGLSSVLGIVRRLGGSIEVDSTPGEGSRFTVRLPYAAERRAPAAAPAATVLFVEDEPDMRSAVTTLLRRKNFQVLEAPDGATAVELLKAGPDSVDVVLLDVTLPGMPGSEVYDELRRIRPDVKVILSTAYSRERTMSEFGQRDTAGFIRKPYQTSELAELLRKTLDE
jgi:two-component system cell cycle sensor histidine kinase/response regulator CckA